jgi:AraC-like DNA-binding protein
MGKYLNISGKVFDRLTALYPIKTDTGVNKWVCRCICGNEHSVQTNKLITGQVKSCGCLFKEKIKKGMGKTHGMGSTAEYGAWSKMKHRCYNKNTHNYNNYGGRGIIVCDRWLNSFENFLEDMGTRPANKHSIDRIDVNGNYELSNCRWATPTEQANNTTKNVYINYKGERLTLSQWSKVLNISPSTISQRIKSKLPLHLILSPKNLITIEHNGSTMTIKEWSEELGIPIWLITQRMRIGMSVDKILSKTLIIPKVYYTYDKETKCLSQWAKQFNISISTFKRKIKKYGFDNFVTTLLTTTK